MKKPKITHAETELLERLWKLGRASVREVREALPKRSRPAYTTVQTLIYRLEEKGAVRRVKKIGNAHIFEPSLTKASLHGRLIDDLIEKLGGSARPLMSTLIESGKLTLEDLRAAEEMLRRKKKEKS